MGLFSKMLGVIGFQCEDQPKVKKKVKEDKKASYDIKNQKEKHKRKGAKYVPLFSI